MKCQSGLHEWIDPVSAERCCSGKWHRATRFLGEHQDLDEKGRIYSGAWVFGWVALPEEVAA